MAALSRSAGRPPQLSVAIGARPEPKWLTGVDQGGALVAERLLDSAPSPAFHCGEQVRLVGEGAPRRVGQAFEIESHGSCAAGGVVEARVNPVKQDCALQFGWLERALLDGALRATPSSSAPCRRSFGKSRRRSCGIQMSFGEFDRRPLCLKCACRPGRRHQQDEPEHRRTGVGDDQPPGQWQLLPAIVQVEDRAAGGGGGEKEQERNKRHLGKPDRRGGVQQQGYSRRRPDRVVGRCLLFASSILMTIRAPLLRLI